MKLLQIDACKNTLSTGKISEDIGNIAIAQGWESWKAYSSRFDNTKPSSSHLIKVGNMLDVYCHVLETRIFDNHGFGLASTFATKNLIKKIDEINPDIIQLHDIKGYWLNLRILFKYFATLDIPIIWTLHDCWPLTGHCYHPIFIPCYKFKTHCGYCPDTRHYPQSYLYDRSFKNYNDKKNAFNSVKDLTFVSVCNWIDGIVAMSFFKNKQRKIIHNGINVNLFKPQSDVANVKDKYNINNKFIILGVASSWSIDKGLNDFIELNGKLSMVQVVLVGLSKTQKAVLPENIVGIERTDNIQEMATLYSAADVFVNATYVDNFPTVNLEALACGTPVITYDTGGSSEAISQDTGFVVKRGDLDGILSAIQIIEAKGKAFYSDKCRKRVEDYFNKDKQFEKYIALYEELLKNKKK